MEWRVDTKRVKWTDNGKWYINFELIIEIKKQFQIKQESRTGTTITNKKKEKRREEKRNEKKDAGFTLNLHKREKCETIGIIESDLK